MKPIYAMMWKERKIDMMSKSNDYQSAFSNTVFIRTWLASLISQLGNQITIFIIPVWIITTTNSPIAASVVNLIPMLIGIFVSPIAGVFADSRSRRKIMILSDLVSFTVMIILSVQSKNPDMSFIVIIVLLSIRSLSSTFFSPSSSAALVTIVEENELTSAIAIQQMTRQFVSILGPLFCGWLIATTSTSTGLFIDSGTYLMSVLILLFCVFPKDVKSKHKIKIKQGIFSTLKLIRHNKLLMNLLFSAVIMNFLGSATFLCIQFGLLNELQVTKQAYGAIFAMSPAGMTLGIAFSKQVNINRKGLFIAISLVLTGIFNLLMGLSSSTIMFGFLFFLSGVAFGMSNAMYSYLYRTLIPIDMQGKFFGLLNSIAKIAAPLGVAISGLILTKVNAFHMIVVIGVLVCMVGLNMIRIRSIRHFTILKPDEKVS